MQKLVQFSLVLLLVLCACQKAKDDQCCKPFRYSWVFRYVLTDSYNVNLFPKPDPNLYKKPFNPSGAFYVNGKGQKLPLHFSAESRDDNDVRHGLVFAIERHQDSLIAEINETKDSVFNWYICHNAFDTILKYDTLKFKKSDIASSTYAADYILFNKDTLFNLNQSHARYDDFRILYQE